MLLGIFVQFSVFILFLGLGVNCWGSFATSSTPAVATGLTAGLKPPGGGGGGGGSPGSGGGGGGGGGTFPDTGSGGGGGGGGAGGGWQGAPVAPAVAWPEAKVGCEDELFGGGDIARDNDARSSGLKANDEFEGLRIPGVLFPSDAENDSCKGVRLRVLPSLAQHVPSPWL